jgi:hypothetical protein
MRLQSTMTNSEIARERLANQHISRPQFARTEEIVAWLGAVQAQDFAGAKWSLGLRLKGASHADIERDFTDGKILRTHLLRPTWHFVAREDIRWLLALTAPRVHQANTYMYRKVGLDRTAFKRSNDALAKALANGPHRTREELRTVLDRAGVGTDGEHRLSYLLMRAELDGVICSGGRRGKQFTYALLDERAPPVKLSTRDEALAELARRYFRSRGPATVHDLVKWSGLTVTDARRGLEAVKSGLNNKIVDGQSLWFAAPMRQTNRTTPTAYLLSIYDEYISGYKHRRAGVTDEVAARLKSLGNALTHVMVVADQIVGAWKPVLEKDTVIVRASPLADLSNTEIQALARAARKYGEFLGKTTKLTTGLNSES